MIKILIITHGHLGSEIVRTAESIMGKQDNTIVLTLNQEDSLETMCRRTEEALKRYNDNEGTLIFTDMVGGTPCNACIPLSINQNIEIVSGINLYMLLSAFMNRKNMDLQDLAKKVISDGIKSIANVKDKFLKKLK